jgi:uncharacterized membrane protein
LLGGRLGGLLLCVIVLLGVGLRSYRLDYQSLWTDEIYSLIVTDPTLTFREFWDRVFTDTHPPIYYLVLRLSSAVFGQSEMAARAPSALFGALTLCVATIVPGALSASSRLVFLLLLAISPGAVWYAREARSYALLLLLSAVITLTCTSFVQCTQADSRRAGTAIGMLTAASILASFTHYFGFLLAMSAFLTCFLLAERRRRMTVVLAAFLVTACVAPWVAYHYQRIDPQRAAWIGELSLVASLRWFEYLSFGGTASIILFIAAAAILLATGGWPRPTGSNSSIWACTLVCLATLAAASLISFHTPILTSRNMIVVLPALYLITAQMTITMVRHWGKIAGATYLAVQIGLMGQPVAAYSTIPINEQWRESAALVLETTGCQSGAIYVYGDVSLYRFFTKRVRPDLDLIEIPEGAATDLSNLPLTTCPILLWIVGVPEWDLDDLFSTLRISRASVEIAAFHKAFVIFRKDL